MVAVIWHDALLCFFLYVLVSNFLFDVRGLLPRRVLLDLESWSVLGFVRFAFYFAAAVHNYHHVGVKIIDIQSRLNIVN